MKIQFLKEDALYQLKANVEYNRLNYSSESNEWIYRYFGSDNNPFLDFKAEIPDFKMFMDSEYPERTDVENAKIIYTALKSLTASQATDERLWAGLAHGQLWDYMQYRMKTSSKNLSAESIKTNFFFKYGVVKSLTINPISRLWWASKSIYDEENEDNPFHLMEYFRTNFSKKVFLLFSSNFANNPKIVKAFLSAIIYIEDKGIKVTTDQYGSLIRYVNMLGGTYILDYLTKEKLKFKIVNYFNSAYVVQECSKV